MEARKTLEGTGLLLASPTWSTGSSWAPGFQRRVQGPGNGSRASKTTHHRLCMQWRITENTPLKEKT